MSGPASSRKLGVIFILLATAIWGVSPLMFYALRDVSAPEVIAHRVIWSLPAIWIYAALTGRMDGIRAAIGSASTMTTLGIAAIFIGLNWLFFVYAIHINRANEAAFGYYLYPLASVLLGWLLFSERPSPLQVLAVLIASIGVIWLGWQTGVMPWLALLVMLTFTCYAVIRRMTSTGPIVSVFWELLLLLPVSLGYLAWLGGGVFGSDLYPSLLLIGTAFFTALPLLLYVEATKRLRFGTVGVLFYVNPTLQFLCAITLLGEQTSNAKLVAYMIIWTAVALYCYALIFEERSARKVASAQSE